MRHQLRVGLLWFAVAMAGMGIASAQVSEVVMHNFLSPPKGANPYSGLVRDPAGNLYGTASSGGAQNAGDVYKLNTSGQLIVLYSFTGGSDGSGPWGGVVFDSAGNLYGTTSAGGTAGAGVVYKLDTTRQLIVLYTFTGGSDGAYPYAGLVRDSAGNLYGTAAYGGSAQGRQGNGVVFKIDTTGQMSVLYRFTGGSDGAYPYAGVILDSSGNLYGTTYFGGSGNAGLVYKLDTSGNETVLYSFTGGSDGANPFARLIRDSAGNLYGTTFQGGAAGQGVVFKVTPSGEETPLYSFLGGTDGANPYGGVVRDSAGNFYGTTVYGGAARAGVVYKVTPAGSENVLYSFTGGADGSSPNSGVIRDSAGNLYGTTFNGSAAGYGAVFKIAASGGESVLYSFSGGSDGSNPWGGLVRDSAGNLYGTTWFGGTGGAGVIFKVDTSGNETVLYNFTGTPGVGRSYSGLIRDSAGNLYGTTYSNGTFGFGTIYKLDASNNYTVLCNFTGGSDGRYPYAGVIRDSSGNLYGTTEVGGAYYGGVIYELSASGQYTVLYNFTGGSDGDYPNGGVTRDSAGNLYGTTVYGGSAGKGVVYELSTSNNLTVLYNFTGRADGANPDAAVIRNSSGALFGTTQAGGKGSVGVLFKLTGVQ